MKYVLVTGGVCSGIGKGVVTSSIGALLKASNLEVTAIKIDPYINIDAGTFSPFEHGEVFVLNDGCEVDLDLGNYERFLDTDLCSLNNITTGKIYQQVISRERQGEYLGKTVQIVPHVTDAIQQWIEDAAKIKKNGKEADVCIIELGGTIGDIEGMPFIMALCQLQHRVKRENFCCCHVTSVPCIGPSRELKSKPTQASIAEIRRLGLHPDMIVCRSEIPITQSIRDKISLSCHLDPEQIFNLTDMKTIYQVPTELQRQGIIKTVSECLKIDACGRSDRWVQISDIAINSQDKITVALVGKYTGLGECYFSVIKALEHACYSMGAKPIIKYIDSSALENEDPKAWDDLKTSNCLLVPGGFGIRGVEGKIAAINWARENGLPFLGICLGFQMAVVEYARNVLGIKNAHSLEFNSEEGLQFEPLIIEMLEYKDPEKKMGGTMRLGLRKTIFGAGESLMKQKYGNKSVIEERHRHRYEINPDYIDRLEKAGLKFVGRNEDGTRMEVLELNQSTHPYFVGVQYHPEYLSRPFQPSPPYHGLIEAGKAHQLIMRPKVMTNGTK